MGTSAPALWATPQATDPVAFWAMIATAIGSLSTVAGVIAAVLAGRAAFALLKVESDRDARTERDQVSAQAALVSCWFAHDRDDRPAEIHLHNGSHQPIYHVHFALVLKNDLLPDGTRVRFGHKIAGARVVPPNRTEVFELETLPVESPIEPIPAVTFRDAGNRWWERTFQGTIRRREDAPPDDGRFTIPEGQRAEERRPPMADLIKIPDDFDHEF